MRSVSKSDIEWFIDKLIYLWIKLRRPLASIVVFMLLSSGIGFLSGISLDQQLSFAVCPFTGDTCIPVVTDDASMIGTEAENQIRQATESGDTPNFFSRIYQCVQCHLTPQKPNLTVGFSLVFLAILVTVIATIFGGKKDKGSFGISWESPKKLTLILKQNIEKFNKWTFVLDDKNKDELNKIELIPKGQCFEADEPAFAKQLIKMTSLVNGEKLSIVIDREERRITLKGTIKD